jgi:hypothetical protein
MANLTTIAEILAPNVGAGTLLLRKRAGDNRYNVVCPVTAEWADFIVARGVVIVQAAKYYENVRAIRADLQTAVDAGVIQ